jgi:hypothetical protein
VLRAVKLSPREEMRSIVLINGVLRGMGFEADCEMVAIRVTYPDRQKPTYSRWSVLDAPCDLPDGLYTVFCDDDNAVPVRREGGLWLAEESPLSGAA